MRNSWIIAVVAALMLGAVGTAQAGGDLDNGKALSKNCALCHGNDFLGDAKYPRIAGKDQAEIIKLVNEYKSGVKKNKSMKRAVKKLTDQEIEDLAAYLSSLN